MLAVAIVWTMDKQERGRSSLGRGLKTTLGVFFYVEACESGGQGTPGRFSPVQ